MMKRNSGTTGKGGSCHSNSATYLFLEAMGGSLNGVLMAFVGEKSVGRFYSVLSLLL